jgi:hypothetical protein
MNLIIRSMLIQPLEPGDGAFLVESTRARAQPAAPGRGLEIRTSEFVVPSCSGLKALVELDLHVARGRDRPPRAEAYREQVARHRAG